jgi:hypothetical protein
MSTGYWAMLQRAPDLSQAGAGFANAFAQGQQLKMQQARDDYAREQQQQERDQAQFRQSQLEQARAYYNAGAPADLQQQAPEEFDKLETARVNKERFEFERQKWMDKKNAPDVATLDAVGKRIVLSDSNLRPGMPEFQERYRQLTDEAEKEARGYKQDQRKIDLTTTLRTKLETHPIYRDMLVLEQQAPKVLNAPPDAAGDLSLIYGIVTMQDPGSSVKDAEFKLANDSGGVPGWIIGGYKELTGQGRLSDTTRARFKAEASRLVMSQRKLAEPIIKNYQRIATRYGLDPEDVVLDLGLTEYGSNGRPASQDPGGDVNLNDRPQLPPIMQQAMQSQAAPPPVQAQQAQMPPAQQQQAPAPQPMPQQAPVQQPMQQQPAAQAPMSRADRAMARVDEGPPLAEFNAAFNQMRPQQASAPAVPQRREPAQQAAKAEPTQQQNATVRDEIRAMLSQGVKPNEAVNRLVARGLIDKKDRGAFAQRYSRLYGAQNAGVVK